MDGGRARILVVDDDDNIRDLVTTVLRYEGYLVDDAETGERALGMAASTAYDVVVLDVMLPDLDGFEIQRRLRGRQGSPQVLFLTALDAVNDRVRGLRAGASDYLVKPFSLDELTARVEAVIRRAAAVPTLAVLQVDDLVLDDLAHEVRRAGVRIELTPTEYRLLHLLLRHRGQALSKAQILAHVWQYDFDGDANVVETYVSYLRRKIDRGRSPLIHTVRGFGYTIRPADG